MEIHSFENMTGTEEESASTTDERLELEEVGQSDDVSQGESKLAAREKIVFAILMTISFYAALESTGIGVALPVGSNQQIL